MLSKSYYFSLIFLATLVLACDYDFVVNAPAKDIPVVYGLLSLENEIHYIRIERAFIDDAIDANTLAQDPNNLYYPTSASVSLLDMNTNEEFALNRADVSTLGLTRDDGIFATDPNILYGINAAEISLNPATAYQLRIDRGDGSELVTAQTRVVANMQLSTPSTVSNDRLIQLLPNRRLNISLRQHPINGVTFDVVFVVHYSENNISSQDGFVNKTVDWSVIRGSEESENLSVLGKEFYEFLGGVLTEDQNITRRIFSIDVIFIAGGQELSDFQDVVIANSGITGAEESIPHVTNLSEGLGIFSSRNRLVEPDFLITGNTIDSLQSNQFTRGLNFVK